MFVMRGVRQAGSPLTRYAMPVSHSHQLLCVSFSPVTMVETFVGFSGVVTSQTSCPDVPIGRRRNVLFLSAFGSPLHARTICDWPGPCASPTPGMCAMYFGALGFVTSTTDVPLSSILPVSRFGIEPA